ncbi:MAG: ribbon-helix-helix protein, CopG family [Geodermatophilaceae bacterium]|jgi:plasmid stability protein|nr:ribbon-helix-helix protein, CopG family [Geodermatophilaceae bacterium]
MALRHPAGRLTLPTLYLPEDLKARLEQVARREGRSEADLVREALNDLVERRTPPRPRGAIFDSGDPDWAATADQNLTGFGET